MANSYQEYSASGVTSSTTFTTPSYLPGRGATDLIVTVDGQVQSSAAYALNGNVLTFNLNHTPANGSIIRITRNSSQDQRLNDYNDAALLTADALDQDANQMFFIAQEALDTASETNLAAGTFYFSQGSAPASTVAGTLWYDTSSSPNVLKVYNGSEWEITSPVTTKTKYSNGGSGGTAAVTDAGTASSNYNGKSYFVDTAFNSKAEVYLNGVKLLNATSLTSIPQYGDYFYDSSNNRVYFQDLASSDILEVVTHSGSFNTMIQTSEDAAAASASAAASSESNASGSASAAAASAGSAAGSATTAANQVPLATAEKTAAIAAKDAAVVAKTAAEAARDDTAVQTVATNLANGSSSTINQVAAIDGQVSTVSGLSTELGVVSNSAYKGKIETVAASAYKANVETVANNNTAVNTAANNIAAIQGAAGNASAASTSETNAAGSATAAAGSASAAATSESNAASTLTNAVQKTGSQTITGSKTFTSKGIFKTTNATTNLQLESTDAGASVAPTLYFKRSSATPAAGDLTGALTFAGFTTDANGSLVVGNDGNGDPLNYAQFLTKIESTIDGAAGGAVGIKVRNGGAFNEMFGVKSNNGQYEIVLNESGKNADFRVETDNKTHGLYVDASENHVGIMNEAPTEALDVTGNIKSSGKVISSDLEVLDATPQLMLHDTNGSGKGFVRQDGTELGITSKSDTTGHGSIALNTENSSGNVIKRAEVLSDGDVKFYKTNGDVGLYFNAANSNIGINSNNVPSRALDVTGTFGATGTATFGAGMSVATGATIRKTNSPPLVSARTGTSGSMLVLKYAPLGESESTKINLGFNGTDPFITNGDGGGGLRFNSTVIKPTSSGYNAADGVLDLGTTNSKFKDLHIDGGVYFGYAGQADVTSNYFDDYEEGTWTPEFEHSLMSGGNTSAVFNYDNATRGHYTKIGNQVFIHGRVVTNSVSMNDASGSIRIKNLPFPTASLGTQAGGNVIVGRAQNFGTGTPTSGQVLNNNTRISLIKQSDVTGNMTTFGQSLMEEHTEGVKNDISFTAVYWTNS